MVLGTRDKQESLAQNFLDPRFQKMLVLVKHEF